MAKAAALQDAVPEVLRELYYIGVNVDGDISTGQQIKALGLLLAALAAQEDTDG